MILPRRLLIRQRGCKRQDRRPYDAVMETLNPLQLKVDALLLRGMSSSRLTVPQYAYA